MKKRGISPLIATVLIIGFVIVLGSMVFIWGGNVFEKIKTESETKSIKELECATKVDLNIKEACDLGDKLRLKLENTGSIDIKSFKVRIFSSLDSYNEDVSESLTPYSVKKFERVYLFSNAPLSIPNKVDVIPIVSIEGKEGYCNPVSNEIKPCFKLPNLNSCEDWNAVGECGLVKDKAEELGIEDEAFKQGIYIQGEGELSLSSEEFVIPEEANWLSISSFAGDGGFSYTLVKGSSELVSYEDVGPFSITQDLDVSSHKGESVKLVVRKSGGGFITISGISYEI